MHLSYATFTMQYLRVPDSQPARTLHICLVGTNASCRRNDEGQAHPGGCKEGGAGEGLQYARCPSQVPLSLRQSAGIGDKYRVRACTCLPFRHATNFDGDLYYPPRDGGVEALGMCTACS